MLVESETLVQRAYDAAKGEAFAIPMTDRWIVFVSDRDQVKLLENEPESVLSMEEALHEVWVSDVSSVMYTAVPELC